MLHASLAPKCWMCCSGDCVRMVYCVGLLFAEVAPGSAVNQANAPISIEVFFIFQDDLKKNEGTGNMPAPYVYVFYFLFAILY